MACKSYPNTKSENLYRRNFNKTISLVFDRLSRVTSGRKVIKEIDGFRFLAIVSVVLFHLKTHYSSQTSGVSQSVEASENYFLFLINGGGAGVNIFFAISGFILSIPFAQQNLFQEKSVILGKYFTRRLTRLEPPYIISMLLFFVIQVLFLNINASELLPNLVASLLYVHYFVYGEWSVINPVAWSLETEVQFYILAPLFSLIFLIPRRLWRRALFVAIPLLFIFINIKFKHLIFEEYNLRKSIIYYLPYFFIGFLFSDIFLNARSYFERKNILFDIIGIFSIIGIFWSHQQRTLIHFFFETTFIFTTFFCVFKGPVINWFFSRRFIVVTGGMCYTIYLIHYPFFHFFLGITSQVSPFSNFTANYLVQIALCIPVLFLVSSAFFILFEKPFMYRDWPKDIKRAYSFIWN